MTTDTTEFEPLRVDLRTKQTAKLTAQEWERYSAIVTGSPRGWFAASDREPLLQYIRLLTRIDKVQLEVDQLESEICATSHGPQCHAAVRLLDMLNRRASAMREELRINPSARGKAMRITRLGAARAQQLQGAKETAAAAEERVPSREGLLFGGARAAALAAAQLGLKEEEAVNGSDD